VVMQVWTLHNRQSIADVHVWASDQLVRSCTLQNRHIAEQRFTALSLYRTR
jgi:hypothetical protein